MNDTQDSGRKIGKWFSIAAWLILLGFLTMFFNDFIASQRNPNQNISSTNAKDGSKEIILKRNRAGHYVATGYINQQPVEFLLDTGATNVAIPAHLAQKLALKPERRIIYQTANGSVQGHTTTISQLDLGNIQLRNVHGGINPGMNNDFVLLGMSFLKQLEFIQRGDKLTIRQYSP
ncbi:MAG: TIGR02281 family clan AA aspartic protease [Gammaproteobacteria bacterium]|nr:TIGR02281 family clan AA aspartic protease [Gammaproteobacteria bacterium]